MPTLSSLVVQRQIASMREVEEAIARQVLHGGDLLTNLLDMAPDREGALAEVLAESLGMPVGPVGRLPPPEHEALDSMGPELALRHAIFPLSLEGQSLLCATSEPLSHESVAELGASIGRPLRFVASPFLRVREGIAAHYGVPLERRLVKIVAKLDGLRAPPGTSTRPPPLRRRTGPSIELHVAADAAPPSFPSVELGPASRSWPEDLPTPSVISRQPLDATGVPHGVREVPPYRRAAPSEEPPSGPRTTPGELAHWLRRVTDAERRARARPPRRKGPLPAGEAEALIDAATSAEGVLDVLFAFASQYFEYSALFGVRGELAEGHDAWGPGTGRDAIVGIGVPLDLPGCLARARERKAPLLEHIPLEGLDRELLADLGRLKSVTRGLALILPVVVRGRTVAILLGDDGASDVDLAGLGPVLSLAHRASTVIERIAIARKQGRAPGDVGPRTTAPPRASVSAALRAPRIDREKAAAALAHALDVRSSSAAPPPGTAPSSAAPRAPSSAAPRAPSSAAPQPLPSDLPGPATDPYLGPPLDDPFDLPPDAYPRARFDPRRDSDETEAVSSAPPPAVTHEVPRSSPLPPPPPSSLRATPIPPSYGVRRGPRPEHAALLARAARGGAEGAVARRALLAEAQGGLASLMAHFPGPLSTDRTRARHDLAPASQCGALLAVLAELGWPALPFVTTRASSADVEQRFWATHLLAELPFVEAATAVVPRLFDDDPSVRLVARRTASRLVSVGLPDDPITTSLDDIAHDPQESSVRRALAIETLGAIRRG